MGRGAVVAMELKGVCQSALAVNTNPVSARGGWSKSDRSI